MKNITQLLEETLINLRNKNIIITPNNFEKEFYALLSKSDLILEDHEEFQYLIETLSENEKNQFEKDDKTTLNLAKLLSNRVSSHDIKLFLKHFLYFISPSLSNYKSNEIQELIYNIAKRPNILVDEDTIRKLRKFTDERIKSDRSLLSEKTNDIKKLIFFFEEHLKNIILEHNTTKEEVLQIRNDLENLDLSITSKEEIRHFQDEMLKIVEKLDESIKKNTKKLTDEQAKCVDLYEQIEMLQFNLIKAEEEKSLDYLTGVLTRRAYVDELKRLENEFNVFDSKYAIVFYDLDYFKKINDEFGHECGDVILNKFAKILNKLTRTGDIISRYGGEEFVALIHYGETIEVKNYLQRVKNIISNNKFIYKENKIDVRFCAGVSLRDKYNSYEDCMKKADELLYIAKANGRDRIVLDTNEII